MLTSPSAPRRALPVLLAVLGLAVLPGCSGDVADADPTGMATPTGRILQGAAPGEANTTLTEAPEPVDRVTEDDLAFMRGMLLHHAQALEMTALVPERGARDDVALFAERIELTQEGEIELMQDWLRQRGEPVFDLRSRGGHDHGGEQMVGMLTPAQMKELAAATGADFDRLFLQYMHQHHAGALLMVEELLGADGGQDSFVFDIAQEIDADQRIEMARMVDMLAEMGAAPLATG